jgi:hypothetical protein
MNLQTIQQTIADSIGIDSHPTMTAIDKDRARKTSDLQTVIAFQWDQQAGHPADTSASRRACARYVRQNVRRMRKEERRKQQAAVDSHSGPDKCGFIFLAFLLEAFFSWLFGRWLDAWWDARNKINDPSAIAAMLAGDAGACAVSAACAEPDDGDDAEGGE